jgi:hypothetical protein
MKMRLSNKLSYIGSWTFGVQDPRLLLLAEAEDGISTTVHDPV